MLRPSHGAYHCYSPCPILRRFVRCRYINLGRSHSLILGGSLIVLHHLLHHHYVLSCS